LSTEIHDENIPNNRRARIFYALAAGLSLIGLADSLYLTIKHVTGQGAECGYFASCDRVLTSPYATVGSVPIAFFGLVAYFTAFSLATLAAFDYRRARLFLILVVAAMFLTTLWLLFVQAFLLRAFCDYCLLSAVTVFLLTMSVAFASFSERRMIK
jgi:uncharacterized membrane protein